MKLLKAVLKKKLYNPISIETLIFYQIFWEKFFAELQFGKFDISSK